MKKSRAIIIEWVRDYHSNNEFEVLETHSFDKDYGFDELDAVEFIIHIEKTLDVLLNDEDALSCGTIGEMYNIIDSCNSEMANSPV